MSKTSHDFQISLVAFQRAQQVSAERQKSVVERVKVAVEEENEAYVMFSPSSWCALGF